MQPSKREPDPAAIDSEQQRTIRRCRVGQSSVARWLTSRRRVAIIGGMDQADLEKLEAAVSALNDGDLEPFIGLIHDDMVWTGQPQGRLWWRHTPS